MEVENIPEKGNNPDMWGGVSDPTKHDPGKFRYLVHAFNPGAKLTMALVDLTLARDGITQKNKPDGDQTVNLFNRPENLAKRISLASSLIDQGHVGTWGNVGLIIEAPRENVIITHNSDFGSAVMSKDLLLQQAATQPVLPANELISQTHPTSYNEVVVLADHNGKQVKLKGFFYKATADGRPLDDALFSTIAAHAKRLNLPLIPIPEPNPYRENKIHIQRPEGEGLHRRFVSVNKPVSEVKGLTDEGNSFEMDLTLNGKRYFITGFGDTDFKNYGQDQISTFTPPEEIETVFEFLENQGMSESEVNTLRARYHEVDAKRQEVKIEFDENGGVESLRKIKNYGYQEIEIRICPDGYADWWNIAQESREFRKMMANPLAPVMAKGDHHIVPPDKVREIVTEATDSSTPEDAEKIRQWYEGVKDNVEKFYKQYAPSSSKFAIEGEEIASKLFKDFSDIFDKFKKKIE